MSNQTIYESEKLNEMRGNYLMSTYNRQEAIDRWKRRESSRAVFKFLMVFSLLVGIALAGILWFLYRNAEGYREFMYAGIGFAAGFVFFIIFAIVHSVVTASCDQLYINCFVSDMHVRDDADAIKTEAIDPVLENSIVISVRAFLEAPAEYEEVDASTPIGDDEEYEYVSRKSRKKKRKAAEAVEIEHFEGPVNSAVVYIDDIEVGAVDLSSEFSVFRVNPGLHTLKLKIRKEYAHFGKKLELQTAVLPVYIDADYRIFYYVIDAKTNDNVNLSYELKLSEYDDMAIFRRDIHNTDLLESFERDADMPHKLRKRAKHLYKKLSVREKYIDTFREEEEKRYLREKYRWDNTAEKQINPYAIRRYRAEARKLYQEMYLIRTNPRISEQKKTKTLAVLNEQMNDLIVSLYAKLNTSKKNELTHLQAVRLKNILLFGQENISCEDLAKQLSDTRQDARIKPKDPEITVHLKRG